jgi:hypothetical protein
MRFEIVPGDENNSFGPSLDRCYTGQDQYSGAIR